MPDSKQHLEQLIVETGDESLEALEGMIAGFNLFDAIGMRAQEIRHSKTLAFLLDPNKPHGLGDYFLRKLLKGITQDTDTNISPIDIDCANLTDTEVWCERNNIDILIDCKSAKIAIAIENKINAVESLDQLKKYDKFVRETFVDGYKVIFVFLTVDGDKAIGGSDSVTWHPYAHEQVIEILSTSLLANETNIGADQKVLIRHYIELMRRHVLPDSDIAKLARKIYAKHKAALDLIIEHKPDLQTSAALRLDDLVRNLPGFSKVKSKKRKYRFAHNAWKFNADYTAVSNPFKKHSVLFEIHLDQLPERFVISLTVGNIESGSKRSALRNAIAKGTNYCGEEVSIQFPRAWEKAVEFTLLNDEGVEGVEGTINKVVTEWERLVDGELKSVTKDATKAMRDLGAIK